MLRGMRYTRGFSCKELRVLNWIWNMTTVRLRLRILSRVLITHFFICALSCTSVIVVGNVIPFEEVARSMRWSH